MTISDQKTNTLYLIYDGDCPLCRNSAQAVKIKQSVGHLEIINARSNHPLVTEALAKDFDLDEGIVVIHNNTYYYGADAIHFLALIGSSSDLFNKINHAIFKYKWLSHFLYPVFKAIRNLILFLKKIPHIHNTMPKPLIQKIYGDLTNSMPKILQDRYSNRPFSKDIVVCKGEMNIYISKIFSILSPLFRLAGALVPYPAHKIPVTVKFISNENSSAILMHRTFNFSDRAPYHFCSKVIHIKDNIVVEKMKFGFASKLIYSYAENKITMDYGGYALSLGKWLIPIPLGFLIGKFDAFEEATQDDQFNMQVRMTHPLFGVIFQYDGCFKIVKAHE